MPPILCLSNRDLASLEKNEGEGNKKTDTILAPTTASSDILKRGLSIPWLVWALGS